MSTQGTGRCTERGGKSRGTGVETWTYSAEQGTSLIYNSLLPLHGIRETVLENLALYSDGMAKANPRKVGPPHTVRKPGGWRVPKTPETEL